MEWNCGGSGGGSLPLLKVRNVRFVVLNARSSPMSPRVPYVRFGPGVLATASVQCTVRLQLQAGIARGIAH
jgi:hypothetical protein